MVLTPRFLTAGDRTIVAEYGDRIDEAVNVHVHAVARALAGLGLPGLVEIVPTYRSLAVHFDPLAVSREAVVEAVSRIETRLDHGVPDPPRLVEIPVVYGGEYGPDLDDVAAHAGLDPGEVVSIHASGRYRVYMMGFTPGFPYLGGVSPRIATPRLSTPRTYVPAGSIGLAAQQTGIYPTASPGGWRLLGRTPVRLFDPANEPPSLLDAGDIVRFVPVEADAVAVVPAPPPEPAREARPVNWVDVLESGMLTTVQDLGRVGYQRYGVPVAGAMDTFSLRAANRLVGNADGDAGLEMLLQGPTLRFGGDSVIAVAGADFGLSLNGRPVAAWQAIPVRAGDVLTCPGPADGLRAYLAVQGGFDVPVALKSRSTYLASAFGGFNGRALRDGDRVAVGLPSSDATSMRAPRGSAEVAVRGREHTVRVMMGPQDDMFTARGRETFLSAAFVMSPKSNRVGCRFDGPRIEHRAGADIVSDATAFGSVQVSGDGMPIVLMCDRGTTGGYTKIATVISADLRILAQARPGDRVRFEAVDETTALAALRQLETWLDGLVPVPDGTCPVSDEVFDEDSGAWLAAPGFDALAAALDARFDRTPASRQAGLRAGMDGVVVAVLAEAGQDVAERDTIVVIEAMKMQNPLRVPRAGRLARICVKPGDTVSADAIVAELEDDGV